MARGRPRPGTPLLFSFQTPKVQFEKKRGRRKDRSSQSRLIGPLSLSPSPFPPSSCSFLRLFASSAVGWRIEQRPRGREKSTQSATTFEERVMVMMSMMAASEPLEGVTGGKKLKKRKERRRDLRVCKVVPFALSVSPRARSCFSFGV